MKGKIVGILVATLLIAIIATPLSISEDPIVIAPQQDPCFHYWKHYVVDSQYDDLMVYHTSDWTP